MITLNGEKHLALALKSAQGVADGLRVELELLASARLRGEQRGKQD